MVTASTPKVAPREDIAPAASQRERLAALDLSMLLPALGAFAVSIALDLRTLLPDVTFWDTGEFQAIGPVLGIAHPTGYPTYTILAWLASVVLQPFGNAAYRADLLSALLVSGAAALTAVAVVQLTRRWVLGLVAGIALAVTPLAWRLGLHADPHALHLFLAALLLALLIAWMQRQLAGRPRAGWWLLAASVVFGLSVGNHALTLLLAPGICVFVILVSPTIVWRQWRLVLACLAAVALTTVAVYAYIPIRASMDPPMDYAVPTDWERFRYLVLGEQFRGTFHALPSLSGGINIIWKELQQNLGWVAWLSLAGVVLGGVRHWRVVVLTVLWFALTFAFALGYINADIERYYVVPLFLAVVWAALGLDAVWTVAVSAVARLAGPGGAERWTASPAVRVLLAAALAIVMLVPIVRPVPDRVDSLDESGDHAGRQWLEATMRALDPNAVIVSWWSFSTPLWYGHWVEGMRPDITIIDDRTILDEGYGDVHGAINAYLGKRPVYLIRLDQDLEALRADYRFRLVAGIPSIGKVYRVLGATG